MTETRCSVRLHDSKDQNASSEKVASTSIANPRTRRKLPAVLTRRAEAEGPPEDASDHFLIPAFHNDG